MAYSCYFSILITLSSAVKEKEIFSRVFITQLFQCIQLSAGLRLVLVSQSSVYSYQLDWDWCWYLSPVYTAVSWTETGTGISVQCIQLSAGLRLVLVSQSSVYSYQLDWDWCWYLSPRKWTIALAVITVYTILDLLSRGDSRPEDDDGLSSRIFVGPL